MARVVTLLGRPRLMKNWLSKNVGAQLSYWFNTFVHTLNCLSVRCPLALLTRIPAKMLCRCGCSYAAQPQPQPLVRACVLARRLLCALRHMAVLRPPRQIKLVLQFLRL